MVRSVQVEFLPYSWKSGLRYCRALELVGTVGSILPSHIIQLSLASWDAQSVGLSCSWYVFASFINLLLRFLTLLVCIQLIRQCANTMVVDDGALPLPRPSTRPLHADANAVQAPSPVIPTSTQQR